MKARDFFYYLYIFFACAILAIGRISDDRLIIGENNFSHIISGMYIIFSGIILFAFHKLHLNTPKRVLLLFYAVLLLTTPVLWTIYGTMEPTVGTFDGGVLNYMNFFLIIVPVSIIIMEQFNYKLVRFMLVVLLGVSLFLAFTSLFGITEREDGRLGVLGGGPIVFARWMQYGILVLLLYPNRRITILKYFLAIGLLVLSFATGSRGPLLALCMTGFVYTVLNFRKIIWKLMFLLLTFSVIFLTTNIEAKLNTLGNTKRVFMNLATQGIKIQSTGTRMDMINRSFDMIYYYPLGVGAGNWQLVANKINTGHLMNAQNFYPHNLFLEVACEYGLHSLLILILLLIYLLHLSYYKMLKYKHNTTSLYPLLFYLLLFFLFNSLVSGMLNDSRLLFVIMSFILIHKPLIITDE